MKAAKDVIDLMRPITRSLTKEHVWVLPLNTNNDLLARPVKTTSGTVDAALFDISGMLRECIMREAAAFIVVHNHPGGCMSPSAEDIRVTKALIEASKAIDVRLLDHIIMANGAGTSLRENGVCDF